MLVPKIMSRQVGVSPVTVIVALLIGGDLLGIVGAILAVPTAAILQVVAAELVGRGRQLNSVPSRQTAPDILRCYAHRSSGLPRAPSSTPSGNRSSTVSLRILEDEQKAHTTVDHRSVVNLSSNNYLGLTTHPKLRAAALKAIDDYGVGTGSVRTIAGTMDIHMELERRLAEFKKVEKVVVFQSGFAANAGTVSAIFGKEDVVISDELNHASIIDGCRLSRATIKVFPHKDVDAARNDHQGAAGIGQRKLLITDGVFSMDGDLGAAAGRCASWPRKPAAS